MNGISSLPGLTRQSILLRKKMDARVKPAHDGVRSPRRREFVTLLGGAAAWPLAARAQHPIPVVGFLNGASPDSYADRVRAFRQGLSETGYIEGRNVAIEYRYANNDKDRLSDLVANLIQHPIGRKDSWCFDAVGSSNAGRQKMAQRPGFRTKPRDHSCDGGDHPRPRVQSCRAFTVGSFA
jgi:hypothetical protein